MNAQMEAAMSSYDLTVRGFIIEGVF